eukprot:Blabericola_migrator_1__2822@NODE_1807_length_3762_cov_37_917185_g1163_i0_p1_GENE_NODE_1807_length_3762_cov_37_917185_g1163_i0NODE_1807_length_3762_cov_37_917185_g1163_i0_p1_ORF_typecomplete_len486_score43_05PilX_N/PF14341_6/0_049PMT_2/PF13231_6/0_27OsmC/PF02566_19/4_3e03OsmC/PF02566_19/0_29OsmC/PF02566_19/3e03_NODE_1807_length_3762_cov_37_917185_g1163_i020403497
MTQPTGLLPLPVDLAIRDTLVILMLLLFLLTLVGTFTCGSYRAIKRLWTKSRRACGAALVACSALYIVWEATNLMELPFVPNLRLYLYPIGLIWLPLVSVAYRVYLRHFHDPTPSQTELQNGDANQLPASPPTSFQVSTVPSSPSPTIRSLETLDASRLTGGAFRTNDHPPLTKTISLLTPNCNSGIALKVVEVTNNKELQAIIARHMKSATGSRNDYARLLLNCIEDVHSSDIFAQSAFAPTTTLALAQCVAHEAAIFLSKQGVAAEELVAGIRIFVDVMTTAEGTGPISQKFTQSLLHATVKLLALMLEQLLEGPQWQPWTGRVPLQRRSNKRNFKSRRQNKRKFTSRRQNTRQGPVSHQAPQQQVSYHATPLRLPLQGLRSIDMEGQEGQGCRRDNYYTTRQCGDMMSAGRRQSVQSDNCTFGLTYSGGEEPHGDNSKTLSETSLVLRSCVDESDRQEMEMARELIKNATENTNLSKASLVA